MGALKWLVGFKVIIAGMVILSGILQFALTHWWRDRRTNTYKIARKWALTILLISGTAGILLLFFDDALSKRVLQKNEAKLLHLERSIAGSLTPDITMELYVGPNHPTLPTFKFEPEFPGVVVVKIANESDYPINHLSMHMFSFKPNDMLTKTATQFNEKRREWDRLLPGESHALLLPADIEEAWAAYDISVRTQAGNTEHNFRFALLPSGWVGAKRVQDTWRTNVLHEVTAKDFPRSADGRPWFSRSGPTNVQLATVVLEQSTKEPIQVNRIEPANKAAARMSVQNALGGK